MAAVFRPLALTPPASLADMGADLAASLKDVGQSLAAGAESLGSLGLPSLPELPPLPGSPPGAGELRGAQSALLSRSVQCLMLSPYDYGLGQRRGEAAWLTPVDALRTLADRLGGFSAVGSNDALVLVLAASVDQAGMASALSALNSAFPLPELQKLERRAQGVATLSQDKFVIPDIPSFPPTRRRGPESLPLSREASRAVGAQVALAEGREAAQKALGDVMRDFAARRQEAVQKATHDLQAVADTLASAADLSGWFGIYLEGLAAEAARLLAGMAPPLDEAFKCCTVLCWYGERKEVAYYKELFGL